MLLFTEGFEWSATVADYVTYGKWLDQVTTATSIGSTSGNLRFGAGTGQYYTCTNSASTLRRAFGSNLAAGCIGFAIMRPSNANQNNNLVVLFDTTSTVQMGLKMNTDGTLSIFRTTHATILGTSTWAMTANVWYYIEFKWAIADSISTNDVIVYVDGTDVLNLAATTDTKNTANAYATHWAMYGNTPTLTSGSSNNVYLDDIYCIDFSGSYNNAVLGPVRVCTIWPTVSGTSSDFVGSDGNSTNNYALVDEVTPNGDTDYVESSTLNAKDTYTLGDLPASINTVYGIQVQSIAKRTDTDARGMKNVIRSDSVDYDQAEHTLTSSYTWCADILEEDPDDSAPFTTTDINNLEAGVKVST